MTKIIFILLIFLTSNTFANSLYDITYRWDGKHKSAGDWTASAADSFLQIMPSSLPVNDVTSFCPRYNSLSDHEQIQFWVYLMSSLAQLESAFKPEAKYTENFVDSSGKKVVSRGLLQLSYESAKLYGCPISSGNDLHDPHINLDCGARIMVRWLKKDKVITGKSGKTWLGIARYWSPFRHSPAKIRSWTKTIPFCK